MSFIGSGIPCAFTSDAMGTFGSCRNFTARRCVSKAVVMVNCDRGRMTKLLQPVLLGVQTGLVWMVLGIFSFRADVWYFTAMVFGFSLFLDMLIWVFGLPHWITVIIMTLLPLLATADAIVCTAARACPMLAVISGARREKDREL